MCVHGCRFTPPAANCFSYPLPSVHSQNAYCTIRAFQTALHLIRDMQAKAVLFRTHVYNQSYDTAHYSGTVGPIGRWNTLPNTQLQSSGKKIQ